MRFLQFGLLVLSLGLATSARAENPGSALYWVDMERVLAALPESEIVSRRLTVERERRQEVIDKARHRLEATQAKLSQADYAKKAEAIEKLVEDAERALDEKQQAWLSPVVARLNARLARSKVVTVSLQKVPLVTPPPACDRSAWLIAVETGKPAPKPDAACSFRGLIEVDVNKLLAELPETKTSQVKLQAFVQSVQNKMDIERQKLRQLERKQRGKSLGDAWALRKAALDSRFEAAQREVDTRRQEAESQLYDILARRLEAWAAKWPAVYFVDVGSQRRIDPTCEATDWVVQQLKRSKPPTTFPSACAKIPRQ